jgi:hypothetical protein
MEISVAIHFRERIINYYNDCAEAVCPHFHDNPCPQSSRKKTFKAQQTKATDKLQGDSHSQDDTTSPTMIAYWKVMRKEGYIRIFSAFVTLPG